ncbi:MAG TPA: DUF1698 domain-containing protein [Candidatus Sulfotelmatobacter sp.]|nr:DUF1698 domain-containing protein [Candidatus Sulfotelmatobacter sp.]
MINSLRRIFFRARNSFENRTGRSLPLSHNFPENPEKLRVSELFNQFWYYSIELLPGIVTKGFYPANLPFLPRILLRKCDLQDMSCLDLGTMEGLIPILMCRGGASSVLAVDAVSHCVEKITAVKHYYHNNFDYRNVGLMYNLFKKLKGRSFDLINCSGLLYHVFSPITILSGVRPLLKRNGLMIVSTNVIFEDSFSMDFNNAGRMQEEANTFWYVSVQLLDYILRYLKLAPIHCIYLSDSSIENIFCGTNESAMTRVRYSFDKPSGYISVLCRAVDNVLPTEDDQWMVKSARESWEYSGLSNWKMAERQPISKIKYKNSINKQYFRRDIECVDLWAAVKQGKSFVSAKQESDSHSLRLSDYS